MIPTPKLDDRTYADIVAEAVRLIPRYCPEWTNHNPSDPGITILELSERLSWARWRLLEVLEVRDGVVRDAQWRREAVDVFARIEALRALVAEMMAAIARGEPATGTASYVKLLYAQVLREFTSLGLRAGGAAAQRLDPFTLGGGHETGNWMFDYMNSFMWSIAGGSNEIQRNLVAERVLGMPREATARG